MIKCLECGEEFNRIAGIHLRVVHNMTADEYLEKHHGAELISKELRKSISEHMTGKQNALGFEHTEEAKKLIGEANIGNHHGLGYKHTEEAKQKMMGNQNALGYVCTETHKQAISKANMGNQYTLGYVQSEEQKQKNREAHLGNQNLLGHKSTKEQVQAQTDSLRAFYASEEGKKVREGMSKSLKDDWKDPEFAKMMGEALHKKPNNVERDLQVVLDKHFPGEWKYVGDYQFWIGGKNPDFVNVTGKKQVIEIFGYYWHDDDEVEPRIAHFKEYGFDCIIFWEFDVYDEEEVVGRVKTFKE